jgi:hypothetical protein
MTEEQLFVGADFEVEKRQVMYADETSHVKDMPSRFVTVRKDTDEALGIVSDDYIVIQHKDNMLKLFNIVKEFSDDFNVKNKVEGGRVYTRFVINTDVVIPYSTKDETAKIMITGVNSYDTSLSFGVSLSMLRMICTNLMIGFANAFTFRQKHLKSLPFNALDKLPEAVVNYKKNYLDFYTKLKDLDVNSNVIELAREKLPKKLFEKAGLHFARHTKASNERNMWEYYNEYTFLISHKEVKIGTKDEQSEMVAKFFLSALQKCY